MESTIDNEEIGKVIKTMILDLAEGKVKVDKIKSAEDRKVYAEELAKRTSFDASKKAGVPFILDGDYERNGPANGSREKVSSTTVRERQDSLDRKRLIPKTFKLLINQPKLNSIFKNELRKLDIDSYPNAVSVLFRVFLEGCIDEYIILKKLNINERAKLINKLSDVADHLYEHKIITEKVKKAVNKSISSPDHVSSIDTYNAYVHNTKYEANPKDLKRAWNHMEEFIKAFGGLI